MALTGNEAIVGESKEHRRYQHLVGKRVQETAKLGGLASKIARYVPIYLGKQLRHKWIILSLLICMFISYIKWISEPY